MLLGKEVDISLIGTKSIYFTTIAQQPETMGRLAVQSAIQLLPGEFLPPTIPVELELGAIKQTVGRTTKTVIELTNLKTRKAHTDL
ncbi:MAG: hypothetical protein ACYS6K_22650 [Planctomycetota bacterium]|jgi:hypothetical protein